MTTTTKYAEIEAALSTATKAATAKKLNCATPTLENVINAVEIAAPVAVGPGSVRVPPQAVVAVKVTRVGDEVVVSVVAVKVATNRPVGGSESTITMTTEQAKNIRQDARMAVVECTAGHLARRAEGAKMYYEEMAAKFQDRVAKDPAYAMEWDAQHIISAVTLMRLYERISGALYATMNEKGATKAGVIEATVKLLRDLHVEYVEESVVNLRQSSSCEWSNATRRTMGKATYSATSELRSLSSLLEESLAEIG